jgi:2-phosphosulfolactate phosphatase
MSIMEGLPPKHTVDPVPGVIRTYLLPQLVEPDALIGGVAVIIDQLRASTTICAALAAGAAGVVPCLTEDDARRVKAAAPTGSCLTGGERGGVMIAGFDLDNSPASYTPERVAGRTIAFTTTNGTRAAVLCRQGETMLVGCLANLSALTERIGADERPVHLICAGTRTRVSQEDAGAAGAIAERLAALGRPTNLADARPDDDSTLLALNLWRTANARPGGVLELLLASRGGRNLVREGLRADVERCARIDAYPVVPEFDALRGFCLHSTGLRGSAP